MLLRQPLWLLLSFASWTLADVEFIRPSAGASVAGGSTFEIEWRDSGEAPSISDLTTYRLFLCTGGNDNPIELVTLQHHGKFSKGNKFSGSVKASMGASTPENAYFLKMTSSTTSGETIINFSPRFTLTGMTGTFSQTVLDGLKTVQGTQGPPTIEQSPEGELKKRQAPAGPAASYEVPYTLQAGPTRYAPMQPLPGTKITKKDASPLHPMTSITIAKTWMPAPTISTTITQEPTHSVQSRVNDATPASKPNDMQKFLARWKD
ncbi:MAG: hypothetical protein M1823_004940 [Watsoniomyces obsoletus]|nr:MAG: hypothetical protein M1823_004940 [Watsoniomyces obsoletus]